MADNIRTLLFSTLYPSSVRPNHGIFVETRLRHLLASGAIETRVVAPVPWFPLAWPTFGEYALHAAAPRQETRNGISVDHPRYLLLPKIGMNLAPTALARSGLAAARRLIAEGFDFDLIDAHYYYPDGVAAVEIGRALGKPTVITARGSDINLIAEYPAPRRMILGAAKECAATITVSAALKARMEALGAESAKIHVLRNGVDLDLFCPTDRQRARTEFGISRFALASVGNLVSNKGHDLVIRAMTDLPDAELLIAGRGTAETALRELAAREGVADRVKFVGLLPQERLVTLYAAVDALVLASAREGMPNVILEAMACGTPVVASSVGGIPEVVSSEEGGTLIGNPSVESIVDGVVRLRQTCPARADVRRHAERFGWDMATQGQLSIFRKLRGKSLMEACRA